jgi:hypothetical protein
MTSHRFDGTELLFSSFGQKSFTALLSCAASHIDRASSDAVKADADVLSICGGLRQDIRACTHKRVADLATERRADASSIPAQFRASAPGRPPHRPALGGTAVLRGTRVEVRSEPNSERTRTVSSTSANG